MTEFHINEVTIDNFITPQLVIRFKIKWWNGTVITNCTDTAIRQFFDNFPQYSKQSHNSPNITKTTQDLFMEKKHNY